MQVLNEEFEVLVGVEQSQPVLVLGVDVPKVLVRVRQNVQDEGRGVLQVHLGRLAELDHLVHQLPGLLDRPPVDDDLRGGGGVA